MGNTDKNTERRKFKRVRVKFIVTYQINKPLKTQMWIENKEIDALMLDLSVSGMALLTKVDVPVLTTLIIRFTLINTRVQDESRVKSMKVMGDIKHNSSYSKSDHRLGILFTQISDEDRGLIDRFIKAIV